jgi:hypothetical protein
LDVIDEVALVIERCSNYFNARHLVLRELYEARQWKHSFLADPELPGAR